MFAVLGNTMFAVLGNTMFAVLGNTMFGVLGNTTSNFLLCSLELNLVSNPFLDNLIN